MRILLSAMIIAGTVAAAPAVAQSQPQSQQQQQVSKAAGADQVICEKEEETGSRLTSHKVCHTRSQWDQLRRDDRSATEHIQSERPLSTPH